MEKYSQLLEWARMVDPTGVLPAPVVIAIGFVILLGALFLLSGILQRVITKYWHIKD
jgi:hypothetical protein